MIPVIAGVDPRWRSVMRSRTAGLAAAAALLALTGTAYAQEPGQTEVEEARPEPVRRIRVLENPYDIASFYRSDQGGPYFGYSEAEPHGGRYPIASYYRSRQGRRGFGYGYGYAPFWNSGYGDGRRRLPLVVGFRRSIGENGDLFLFAPTFLAPLGPLTGAFLDW
jgi:hypothetical protein